MHLKLKSRPLICSSPLLDGILSCVHFGSDDADGRKHGEAAVVDLPLSHLLGVLVEVHGVPEVAGLLVCNLPPRPELEDAGQDPKDHKAVAAGSLFDGLDAGRHALEAGQSHEVLKYGSDGRHHRHAAVLQLRRAKPRELLLIAQVLEEHAQRSARLGKVQGVEEAQRWHGPDLLRGVVSPQGRRRVCAPVSPSRSGETILEEHAHDGHHR
mmetsp:Transcript_123001/g.173351  ORF Transcript_123001/g.173351 Transcript_123001/m.173351 type:complete len:211 (+) Transcript_123001:166-798(+)